MRAPTNRQIFTGENACYWFDDKILVALSTSNKRTVENIKDNVALVKRITGNNKFPLLIYLADAPAPDKETRKFAVEQLAVTYSAIAMVSKPSLTKIVMNIFFALKPPPIPMKGFTDVKAAKKWLQQFIVS